MTGISWMLQEAAKCPPVEYVYDLELDLADGEVINETMEVEYEYSYDIDTPKYNNIFTMLRDVLWPTKTFEYEYDYEFDQDGNLTMFPAGNINSISFYISKIEIENNIGQ